jgi:Xaa-Pro aminopeptidase
MKHDSIKNIFNFLPNDVEAFLISTEDELLQEYTPNCNKRLQFLTNFSGSYGFAVISKNSKHGLFVDGRYTIQAKQEVEEGFEIHSIQNLIPYLKNIHFAINTKLHSYKFIQNLEQNKLQFTLIDECPVDKIWNREINVSRETFDFELSSKNSQEKINEVLNYLTQKNADAIFISNPQDTCYLFNIRGKYLEHSPIAPYFSIVSRETSKIIYFQDLNSIKLGTIVVNQNIPYYIKKLLEKDNKVIVEKENFIENKRIIKTEKEIEFIKNAHLQDKQALKNFINWLKKANLEEETEYTIGCKLKEFREQQNGFAGESFHPIVGFKENGAIVHYKATKENAKQIEGKGLLLIDSGGQYYDKNLEICGTTDITRVFAIGGEPSNEEKRAYTLVLKGHIALASSIFPVGTKFSSIDILARQFLWQEGKNYSHDTAHGVGFYLSVHEKGGSDCELKAGMVISNEPGFYLENNFGVRFESLMYVKNSKMENFLEFEVLTKCEIDISLLDYTILTDLEVEWLTLYTQSLK